MEGMSRSSLLRTSMSMVAIVLLICPLTAGARQDHYRGRKFKPPPPVSRITVTVLRNDDETPINDAHVIFHPYENGKDKGGMELKTNEDGVAVMTVIPIGDTILLQVIAHGYQTFGGEYKIGKAEESMQIKMKLPGQQYSVYDNHDTSDDGAKSAGGSAPSKGQNGANGSSNGNTSSGSAKGSSSDKSTDSPKN